MQPVKAPIFGEVREIRAEEFLVEVGMECYSRLDYASEYLTNPTIL